MYTNIIHNDDICNYFLKNQQFIFNSLGNCRECRLNGVIHNPNKRLKVSICKDIFYVDRQWHSDSGFQQLVLAYNGKARTFRDRRKFVRRALCKMDEHVF